MRTETTRELMILYEYRREQFDHQDQSVARCVALPLTLSRSLCFSTGAISAIVIASTWAVLLHVVVSMARQNGHVSSLFPPLG